MAVFKKCDLCFLIRSKCSVLPLEFKPTSAAVSLCPTNHDSDRGSDLGSTREVAAMYSLLGISERSGLRMTTISSREINFCHEMNNPWEYLA